MTLAYCLVDRGMSNNPEATLAVLGVILSVVTEKPGGGSYSIWAA